MLLCGILTSSAALVMGEDPKSTDAEEETSSDLESTDGDESKNSSSEKEASQTQEESQEGESTITQKPSDFGFSDDDFSDERNITNTEKL